MTKTSKREQLVERIEAHLRHTARHLVKFDTLEETLHYIIDSFWLELPCDFVGIIMRDHHQLIPKIWKGGSDQFEHSFPISLDHCSPNILEKGWDVGKNEDDLECDFHRLMKRENISTWFTIPLKVEDDVSMGFCIIGFHNFVPLISETEQIFVEFGKDIAMAMNIAQNKEVDRKKMKSIKWFNDHFFPGSSIEQLVEKIVELSHLGTNSNFACVYLYEERNNRFIFQPPSHGLMTMPEIIMVGGKEARIEHYFPYFEKIGDNAITIPLIVHLKTIGILHVAHKKKGVFTAEDYEVLDFLSRHISTLLENARLYKMETDSKNRLQTAIGYQQELVKQTLDGENYADITLTLSSLLLKTIFLFDRFLRPISYKIYENDSMIMQTIIQQVQQHHEKIHTISKRGIWIEESLGGEKNIGVWPVIGGGDLLGYLVLHTKKDELDEVHLLTIENALNVYAIQFIKQKLVVDTKAQVKEGFINQLFEENIEDEQKIMESANLFNWNLFTSHRIATLSIDLVAILNVNTNLLDMEAKKNQIWQTIKENLLQFDPQLMLTRKGSELIMIVPVANEGHDEQRYWKSLYQFVDGLVVDEDEKVQVFIGVGGMANKIHEYFFCYNQAILAQNVVKKQMRGVGFAFFDDLGVYTLLTNLKESSVAILFIKKYLDPILQYADGKGADLFHTLRMFLFHNGNWKNTMDALYIHRSTLRYRLERIKDILEVDIDDAESRLNLMIAYKLYDLYVS